VIVFENVAAVSSHLAVSVDCNSSECDLIQQAAEPNTTTDVSRGRQVEPGTRC
jgi:hypothetical protein